MSSFRPIKGGKPFNIPVIQDELAGWVSQKDAISWAISICSSLIDELKHSGQAADNQDVMQSLDRLCRILKERTFGSQGPNETRDRIKETHHDVRMVNSPPEAILGQDWVNRQAENPDVRLPIFGVSRPMSVTSAQFLHNSIDVFGPRSYYPRSVLDRLVPESGAFKVYYTPFYMPQGGKGRVLRWVASRLHSELGRALEEPEVRDELCRLEREFVSGELSSADRNYLDAASGTCFKPKLAVVAGTVANRFKSMRHRTNRTATPS